MKIGHAELAKTPSETDLVNRTPDDFVGNLHHADGEEGVRLHKERGAKIAKFDTLYYGTHPLDSATGMLLYGRYENGATVAASYEEALPHRVSEVIRTRTLQYGYNDPDGGFRHVPNGEPRMTQLDGYVIVSFAADKGGLNNNEASCNFLSKGGFDPNDPVSIQEAFDKNQAQARDAFPSVFQRLEAEKGEHGKRAGQKVTIGDSPKVFQIDESLIAEFKPSILERSAEEIAEIERDNPEVVQRAREEYFAPGEMQIRENIAVEFQYLDRNLKIAMGEAAARAGSVSPDLDVLADKIIEAKGEVFDRILHRGKLARADRGTLIDKAKDFLKSDDKRAWVKNRFLDARDIGDYERGWNVEVLHGSSGPVRAEKTVADEPSLTDELLGGTEKVGDPLMQRLASRLGSLGLIRWMRNRGNQTPQESQYEEHQELEPDEVLTPDTDNLEIVDTEESNLPPASSLQEAKAALGMAMIGERKKNKTTRGLIIGAAVAAVAVGVIAYGRYRFGWHLPLSWPDNTIEGTPNAQGFDAGAAMPPEAPVIPNGSGMSLDSLPGGSAGTTKLPDVSELPLPDKPPINTAPTKLPEVSELPLPEKPTPTPHVPVPPVEIPAQTGATTFRLSEGGNLWQYAQSQLPKGALNADIADRVTRIMEANGIPIEYGKPDPFINARNILIDMELLDPGSKS
jgi:hypothetical protein